MCLTTNPIRKLSVTKGTVRRMLGVYHTMGPILPTSDRQIWGSTRESDQVAIPLDFAAVLILVRCTWEVRAWGRP